MTLRTLLVRLGFKGDASKLVDFDKKITSLKSNILGLGAVFASATAALGYFLNEAAKLEQTKIAFEVMTNSVQLGQQLIKDLFKFARTTPFQIPGIMQASKILLAMGVTAEEQIPTLEQLGHVAAGINKPLDQLASIFGRVKAAGYLTGYEMERLRRAGVPLGQYLSEMLKKPEKDILTMIRRKEISFEMFAEGWEIMVEKRFPQLMDKLLLTFKGITSNIKDYIYEIVAFSGEELLPIAKLMANQLAYLLDSSRELIGLKFKAFFQGVSRVMDLLNKTFIIMYFRTRETAKQLGGFNRLFKIFATIFGTIFGVKALTMLGKFAKMSIGGFLNPANLKLALLGIALLSVFAIADDIFAFLSGKKSFIGDLLDTIEKKFPKAFRHIELWLKTLKKEIEGFSLLLIGLFEGLATGDWSMAKEGLKQISDAYNMLTAGVKDKKKPGDAFDPFSDVDVEGMNFVEGTIAQSKLLKDIAEKMETWKRSVDKWPEKFAKGKGATEMGLDEFFFPAGVPDVSNRRGLIAGSGKESLLGTPDLFTKANIARKEKEIESFKASIKSFFGFGKSDIKVDMPITIDMKQLPVGANSEEVANKLKDKLRPLVRDELGNTLRNQYSAIKPRKE